MKFLKKILFIYLILTPAANLFAEGKLALLYSKQTENLMKENPLWINDHIMSWELFLMDKKFQYEVIYDDDLESGLSDDYSVLIIPSARSLSEKQISSVKNFLNEGRSVFATWSFGTYNENGLWSGWNNLEEIIGVKFISEIKRSEVSRIHSINGDTPLSAGIPAGFRMQFTTYDSPVEVKINSNKSKALGYWYSNDFPFAGKTEEELSTSIVYGNSGNGKFIWTGFDILSIVGSEVHQKEFNKFLINSLNWLSNNPVYWVETWPEGKKAAAVLSCDVEFQFENINNALDIMEEKNVEGQFYILTDVIEDKSLQRILNFGDIGTHGDNHNLFKWQDYYKQADRLKKSIEIIEDKTGRKIISFRPPETMYDENTIRVIKQNNIKILSSDFIEDRAVPHYLNDNKELMIIPKTGYDDYDILYRLKINKPEEQAERYLLDFKRVYSEGGLYILYYHTQIQCLNEYVSALETCIDELKNRQVWITTSHKIKNWWDVKENIILSSYKKKNGNVIEIKNNSSLEASSLVFSFVKSDIGDNISVLAENEDPDYTFNPAEKRIRIFVDKISPYGSKRFIIQSGNI